MTWTDSQTFKNVLNVPTVKHKVNGVEIEFYPISVGMMFTLRKLGKPIARALAVFFESKRVSVDGKAYQTTQSADGFAETISEGVSLEIIKLRYDQQAAAIEQLFDGLSGDDSVEAVGKIILDSVRRSMFSGIAPADLPNGAEFLHAMGLPQLPELIVGVVKANKGVLGPLAGQMESAWSKAAEAVAAKLTTNLNDSTGETGQGAASESPPQTPKEPEVTQAPPKPMMVTQTEPAGSS